MTGFDLLGQTYLMCTVFGWGFMVFSLLMGHFGHDNGDSNSIHSATGPAGGHSGGYAGAGDSGGHFGHDSGHGLGHIGGHANSVIDAAHGIHHLEAGGHGFGHGHSGLTGSNHIGQHSGHASGAGASGTDTNAGSHSHGQGNSDDARTGANPVLRQHGQKNLYFTLLSIFSPMTISIFIGFFGVTGIVLRSYLPWLGVFTLIPAILAGIAATNIMKATLAWATSKLTESSLTSSQQAIGQIAEVNTPIKDGRLGEVTYIIGLTRFNAAARVAHAGSEIARGVKVIIVETDGPVVLVEPFEDALLEGR